MFLNYLPSGMSEVVGITMVFAFLVGVILTAMFTADKGICTQKPLGNKGKNLFS